MRLRRKLWLGAGALFLLLPVLFLVEEHFRGKWALERWKAKMTARGEKFDMESLVPTWPDDADNGYSALLRASGQLASNPGLVGIAPPTTRFAAPGKVIFSVAQSGWQSSLSASNVNWSILGEQLTQMSDPLEDVRAALKKPACDGHLNYQAGFSLMLPHLARFKSTASYLSAATMNELHDGHLEKAIENLESLLALARCQQNEPIVISQLVRIAIATIGFGVTWQALQTPGWTDSQLARMQEGWQSMEFLPAMGRSLEMERAMLELAYENARRSAKEAEAHLSAYSAYSGGGGGGSPLAVSSLDQLIDYVTNHSRELIHRAIYIPLWRFAWSYQDELNYLEIVQTMIETNRVAARTKSGVATAAFSKQLESQIDHMAFYSRMRFAVSLQSASGLSGYAGKAISCETLRALALAAIALKRYELAHQKAAPTLAALVPEFLPSLPADYMDGQPLRYQLTTNGTFRLYSVGKDQLDDGGDAAPASQSTYPLNLLAGRDIVWPEPASPEEIAAYERTKSKKK